MRSRERWEYLGRSPRIVWDAVVRGQYSFPFDLMPITVRNMSVAQRVNLLKSGFNLAYRRLQPWSWPLHMQIELTSYCDLACPICPTGRDELDRDAKAIDVRLFDKLMEEVGPYLLTVSLWAWGEPLLHKGLEEILRIAARYPVATLLSTNGQSLDQDRVQRALRAHPPAYLIVAVDGLCDETNSVYRVGARLKPALDGVRALAEWKRRTGARRPVLHCRFMAMKHNEHELPQLREFSSDAGFDLVSVRGLSIIDSDEAPHSDMVPVSALLRAYEYAGGKRVPRDDFVCQHAFTFPTVMADGTVVACEQDFNCRHPLGTLTPDNTFAGIWRSRHAAGIRGTIRDTPDDFSFCRNCPFADRPTSSCSLESYELQPRESWCL